MIPAIQLALITCPPDAAEPLARALVEARVCACVNIVPAVTSIYRWKGELQREGESLLLVKFPAGGFAALRDAVLARHSYEVPEVIALDVADGHTPYLQWVVDSCR